MKINKKIYLEITPFFPTVESFRGPYVYDQVKAIQNNSNYEVIVIKMVSLYEKAIDQEYTYQGIKVYNFKVYDLPSSVLPGLFQAYNLHRLKQFIKNIAKIDMNNVELIHSHVTYPAGALAVELGNEFGIKSFVQHHGLDVMQLGNGRLLKGKLKELNNRYIKIRFLKTVNTTALNIGVSQKVIDELEKIEGFSNPNTYVLYNGVDTNKFYKKETKKRSPEFTIGCIGNFWPLKDQMTLLKALNILSKEERVLKIKFVGSGPTLQSCRDYVAKHHLEEYVEFLSEIDHTQLNDFYNTLDLFVLPSYYEALGCVYTEALQVGVPVIAIKGQGIEELIKEKDQIPSLMSPHDHDKLAELIRCRMAETHPTIYDLDIDRFINDFLKENHL